MSDVWRRLSNVARGKLKTLLDSDDLPQVDRDALQRELGRLEAEADILERGGIPAARGDVPRAPAPEVATPLDARERKRQAIDRAWREGVLTDEERDAKLAELNRPPRAKKRDL